MTSLLATAQLTAFYGDFQALFGVNLAVEEGEVVAVIGANGAGKSTLLRTICGLLPAAADRIRYRGDNIGALPPADIVARGIALVPEGRKLFPSLSVEENLLMGQQCGRKGPWHLDRVYALFPMLRERRRQSATALSGGQQQMAAIGRALMTNPELLLCDEISLGLAPIVIRDVYAALPGIRAEGTTLIVVEQDIARALGVADRVYCLQEGRVTLEGRPADLTREQIKLAYFGV
jgi:branched-chain amino acid transport system ATP-binding protein